MRRARGCGGRFLNTKKLSDDMDTNSVQQKEPKSGVSNFHGSSSIFEDMLKRNSSSNDNNDDHHGLSSTFNFHLMGREEAVHYFKKEKGNLVNQIPKRDPYYK